MYNRYVPQSDGSFQRNRIPDAPPEPPAAPVRNQAQPPRQYQPPQNSHPGPQPGGIGGFFRQLLPRDFCTEDLLIVLLLLLMSGESKEDQNFALLTLALYLFL